MASPELAIAQAALSATLFRADPTSLSRPAVDAFFPLLSSTVARCSRPNVQKCRTWIVDNVVPSTGRTAALAKFLLAFSRSLELEDNGLRPSLKRRRLHVLYVLNDVLFHAVTRHKNYAFASKLEETLPALVATAAVCERAPKHTKRVEDLVAIWEEKKYFAPPVVSQLRDAVASGTAATTFAPSQPAASLKLSKDAPYILPSVHGDSSAAWYDLPAATWLSHLVPNSTKPMLPDLIRPVQLTPGPADKNLVSAVQALISDVDRLFSKDNALEDNAHSSMNDLGARVVLDEVTGNVVDGDTYYGWSRQFCDKMKTRAKNGGKSRSSGRQSRSRSRSIDSRDRDSRSASPPAFKRRRFSPRSASRSSGRSRSRSVSRSRNQRAPSRSRDQSEDHHRSRSTRRRSYSRSASPPQRGFQSGHRDRSPVSYPRAPPYQQHQHQQPPTNVPPPPDMPLMAFPGAFQGVPPYPLPHNMPFPPPPPLPMAGNPMQNWPMNPGMPPQMMGGWTQPPPPPPPMHQMPPNYHHNNNGRGRGGYRGRGRGGYDHSY